MGRLWSLVRARLLGMAHELSKFGAVGAVAYLVDVGLFNLLSYGPGQVLGGYPLTAKVVSVSASTLVAWVGNRSWTFRSRENRGHITRELVAFLVVSAIGLFIGLACLGVSHHLLGLTSALADNISANGVGLVLATLFRFWAYRTFVFRNADGVAGEGSAERTDAAIAAALLDDIPTGSTISTAPSISTGSDGAVVAH